MHEMQRHVTCAPLSITPVAIERREMIVEVEKTEEWTHFYEQRCLFSDVVDKL